jgi:hypothetical protein
MHRYESAYTIISIAFYNKAQESRSPYALFKTRIEMMAMTMHRDNERFPLQELPPDYIERVYAGVLGKIIGVYLGRPFEGWT